MQNCYKKLNFNIFYYLFIITLIIKIEEEKKAMRTKAWMLHKNPIDFKKILFDFLNWYFAYQRVFRSYYFFPSFEYILLLQNYSLLYFIIIIYILQCINNIITVDDNQTGKTRTCKIAHYITNKIIFKRCDKLISYWKINLCFAT